MSIVLKQPSDYGFKHPGWRTEQPEGLNFLMESQTRTSVMELPPGIGKTTIAIMYALLTGKKTWVLTNTKQLQEQYLAEHALVYSIKGKGNYQCVEEPEGTGCDLGACNFGWECPRRAVREGPDLKDEECLYFQAKEEASWSPFVVTNYSYFLNIANYDRTYEPPDVLICDEAHMVEDEILSFAGVSFSKRTFERFGLTWEPEDNWPDLVRWMNKVEEDLATSIQVNSLNIRKTPDDVQALNYLVRMIEKIGTILTQKEAEYVIEMPDDDHFEVKPVFAREHTQLLFGDIPRIILMSATVEPLDKFNKMLGVEDSDYLRIDSPYDPEKRPIHYWPVASMSRVNKDTAYPLIVEAIDAIIDARPGVNGIIHTVSYPLANYIIEQSAFADCMMTHGDDVPREEVIASFKQSTGKWLVSPSIEHGVDLPYEECRVNVICKTPYGYLGSEQIRKQMEEDAGIYQMKTLHRLIQMIGRAMRAPDDWGETFILDKTAGRLVRMRRKWVPTHIVKEMSREVTEPPRRNDAKDRN